MKCPDLVTEMDVEVEEAEDGVEEAHRVVGEC